MTCPNCGCTIGWDCECGGALLNRRDTPGEVLFAAAAYGFAILSRLSQEPPPALGSAAYAASALEQLRLILRRGDLLDQVEARVQELPRTLLS